MQENTKIEMDLKNKEKLIDELLVFMKNAIENEGLTIKLASFNFRLPHTEKYLGNTPDYDVPEGEHLTSFKKLTNIQNEEFDIVFKCCLTHEFIDKMYCGDEYTDIQLTNKGMARANSVEKATIHEAKTNNSNSYTFTGTINAGNLQIGDNNTQNIEKIINNLKNEIEKTNATNEEKNNAKNLIDKFFSNPIISAVISGATSATIKALMGGL